MNNDWRELYRDKRKLFVVVSIVVPFLVYCGYYYGMMIKNAPFRADQFEYLVYQKMMDGKVMEKLDTRAGIFNYYSKTDSMISKKVDFDPATLKEIHLKMMDILFWNIRTISGDSTDHEHAVFYVKAVYLHKSKTVWWQPHYFEDPKLEQRMGELVRSIRSLAIRNIKN